MDICMTDSKKDYLEFVVGPYLASAQMAYLYNEGAVQAVHGPLDLLLLYPKLNIIISYDETHFEWTNAELIMKQLDITKEKFEELVLLWTYPPETLENGKDLVTKWENTINKNKSKPSFAKLKALYNYPVIFDSECICRTLEKGQKMPKETEEFMGIKLPTKSYLYLLLGLISQKVLSVMVFGKILEYANVVKNDLLRGFNLNNKAVKYSILLNLLKNTTIMKPYLEKIQKIVYLDRLSAPANYAPLNEPPKDPIFWDVAYSKIAEEMDRQFIKENQIGPLFCMKWYINDASKSSDTRSLKKLEKPKEMKKARELLCHTLFMLLENRNYISGEKSVLILGNLYQNILPEFQDEAMIFVELLTYGGLSGINETVISEDKKNKIYKQLISEIFSLVSMKLKKGTAEDWNEYSIAKEFANFMTIARSAWSACREFVEGLLFTLFCSTDESKALDIEEFEKAYELLPFGGKPNYLLGLLMLFILDEADKKEDKKAEHPLVGPSKKFVLAEDIVGDIKRGYTFWNFALSVVNGIYALQAIDKDKYELFVEANKFLEAKLEQIGIKEMIISK